ncbi:IS66 family transposase [Sphaerimonospora cavernae]|uniref:IS66 family transposase n=1 Tax=Sphaerimonospora cavernae TaxID=1740611 RepID=A0ABV6UDW8_9ACTN
MPALEELSRDELIALVGEQTATIAALEARDARRATQIAELMETVERLEAQLAKALHLLSRNSQNSSMPPSRDDDVGKTPPDKAGKQAGGKAKRSRGKQPGAAGTHLAWRDKPDAREDRFPQGACACGQDLAGAVDLGVVDRYQQHEIPLVSVKVTQFDQHAVVCRCGRTHTAARPEGAAAGQSVQGVGYGPSLQAFAVFLLVVQFVPVRRVVAILQSLTGAAPSAGFVHGMLARTAGLLAGVEARIRALLTVAYALCVDETPIKVGPATPKPGRKTATMHLLVACTEAYTLFLLGDRSLETFKKFVFAQLNGAVIVHDRYKAYDSAELVELGGRFTHQLCTAHLLRDLAGAAQTYPGQRWPTQITDALRALIHHANTARDSGRTAIDTATRDQQIHWFRHGVRVGLSATVNHGNRPGEAKARALLEVLRDRQDDVLRFAHDLNVPPTSNQAERDLRPSKICQNISGRLTSPARAADRYRIYGYVSTAIKHGQNAITVLRDAVRGHPWMPPIPGTA